MRRLVSFGRVTAGERRQADLFFDELVGVRARPRPPVTRAGAARALPQAPVPQPTVAGERSGPAASGRGQYGESVVPCPRR